MSQEFCRAQGGWKWRGLGVVCCALLWVAGPAMAQTAVPEAPAVFPKASLLPPKTTVPVNDAVATDNGVVKASCSSCGGVANGPSAPTYGGGGGTCGGGCSTCGGGQCVPGRLNDCSCCMSNTYCGNICCGIYNCICCPDPCYLPRWTPLANAAFFADGTRPVTQMRLRWDTLFGIPFPDRAEYWLARDNVPGSPGRGLNFIPRKINVEELSFYNEVALGRFSAFVEIPYHEIDTETGDANASLGKSVVDHSGFGDMNVGTKSLLLDCELLQIALQFKTYIPIASTGNGLGNGHVSLEPALLFGLKLAPTTFMQAEVAYWIPISGDNLYQGNIFHAHVSFNQLLCCLLPDVQLFGTLEMSEWSIVNGNATETNFLVGGNAVAVNATQSMFSAGPGLRLNICDKIDFGVGTQFGIGGSRWADDQIRAEFRWRF